MKITELLVESQQLDEGPFTQAVGKVGGKIAKGVANIGKDLKTGFKTGYSGEEPAAEPSTSATTAPTQVAPAKKAGGLKGFVDQFKKGFAQGREEPAAEPATTAAPSAATNTSVAAPVTVDPAAEKASKIGVGQINKIIPTLRTRDLMSLKKNLDAVIANKQKAPVEPAATATDATTPPASDAVPAADAKVKKSRAKKAVAPTQAEIDADRERLLPQNSSIIRTGSSLSETLACKVQEQKQRMYETALMSGTQSVFKK